MPNTIEGLLLSRYEQIAFVCRHGHQRFPDVLEMTLVEVARLEWAISRWTVRELFPA